MRLNLRVAHLRSFVVAALAVAAGATTIAGCGGDEAEPRSRDAEGPTRQDWVSRADAICADANTSETALEPGPLGWHSGPRFDDPEFLSRFNAVGRAALKQLRALTPPAQDSEEVAAVLSAVERSVAAIDAQIAARRADARRTAANVRAYERAYHDLAAAAGPVGLGQCQGLSN
jgi:hypothetical protein